MLENIFTYKPHIDAKLSTFLTQKKHDFQHINSWSDDLISRLLPFVTSGKTIRGCLLLYAYEMFQKNPPESVWQNACGLELYHSGLLIHDDIMDNDQLRRGKPSIHKQLGIPQAINAGDFCFFLGSELLPSSFVSVELQKVVLGQMQDIAGTGGTMLSLYTYKTARYTFSLPLSMGAQLAGAPKATIAQLEELGEYLGLIYQIRDDELDGDPSISPTDYSQKAKNLLRSIQISDAHAKELLELLDFCQNRET